MAPPGGDEACDVSRSPQAHAGGNQRDQYGSWCAHRWPLSAIAAICANLLSELQRHCKSSRQSLFANLETMATHGAYTYTYMPEVDVPGGGRGSDRCTAGHGPDGLRDLLQRARSPLCRPPVSCPPLRRPPTNRHMEVARFTDGATIEAVMQAGNAAALITYYAVDAIGYRPPPLPALVVLDVPYLGTMVLEAGRTNTRSAKRINY